MSQPDRARSLSIWSGSALQPLPMRNSGQRIAERLITAIALGQFVAGQRLPSERELAASLEVSRTSVREAIAQLVATGYVSVRRGRTGGAYVTGDCGPEFGAVIRRSLLPGWDRLRQLLDFRSSAEAQLARLAAERHTDAEGRAIVEAAASYLRAGQDRDSSRSADQALHQAIARAAHNPFWEQLSLQLRHEVTFGLGCEPFTPDLRRRAEGQHPALAQAVSSGDGEEAAQLAQRHFSLNDELIDQVLSDARGAQPGPAGTHPTGGPT